MFDLRWSSTLTSAIITLCVGREQRLFAAHEDVLRNSPFFVSACRGQFFESSSKRIDLPDEYPEVFSCILEYLYKGDYYPRVNYDKRRNSWHLEAAAQGESECTIYHPGYGVTILKDTMVYVGLPFSLSNFSLCLTTSTVRSREIRLRRAQASRTEEARTPVRNPVQHNLDLSAVCIRTHTGQRLEAAGTLSRPHHS